MTSAAHSIHSQQLCEKTGGIGGVHRIPALALEPAFVRRLDWRIVLGLLAGALCFLPFDLWLARWFMGGNLPGELRNMVHKSEMFGHAYGVLGIALSIYFVAEHRRHQIPRLLASAFSAGLASDVVKILFHRVRPVDFSFAAGDWTFRGLSFLHVDSWGGIFDSQFQSFPSAHTATATGFAMGLAAMYPRAAKWFLFVAALCAASRFDGGAHFVSDTFIGGLVGYLCGVFVHGDNPVARWITSMEVKWSARSSVADTEPALSPSATP